MNERKIGNELILLLGVIILPVYLHNNPILLSFHSGMLYLEKKYSLMKNYFYCFVCRRIALVWLKITLQKKNSFFCVFAINGLISCFKYYLNCGTNNNNLERGKIRKWREKNNWTQTKLNGTSRFNNIFIFSGYLIGNYFFFLNELIFFIAAVCIEFRIEE